MFAICFKRYSRVFRGLFFAALILQMVAACAAPTPTAVSPTDTAPAPATSPTNTAQPTETTSNAILVLHNEPGSTIVRNFNPFSPNHLYETTVSIYEPLLIYNKATGDFVPWLATDYKFNADATALTFTIRQGVKWSDGQDFGPNDVVFTYDMLQKFPALDTGGIWANLDSAKVGDNNSVVFTFKKAFVPGLLNLGQVPIVAEHIWKDVADPVSYTNDNPVGTGPFTQVTTFTVSFYQVEKNPYYWQKGKPTFQGIKSVVYGAEEDQLMALANGDLDWDSSFFADIETSYKSRDPEHNNWTAMCDGNATFVYMNTTEKPFDDVNVRKAISMALDRETMLHTALYDYSQAPDATGLTYSFTKWKDPDIVKNNADLVSYNPDKANEMLDAAGLKKGADGMRTLPDGTPMKFYVDNAGWADYAAISQIVAQNLKKVGISAEARSSDPNAWFDKVFKGNFDIAVGWSATGSTPYETYRGLMSSETFKPVGEQATENWQRVSDKQADDLLAQLAGTPDFDKAQPIVKQLEQRFIDIFPAAPIYNQCNLIEWSTRNFTGWPDPKNPSVNFEAWPPTSLMVLNMLEPVK
jgi:peptide/nickel transport system substrate-binding protein